MYTHTHICVCIHAAIYIIMLLYIFVSVDIIKEKRGHGLKEIKAKYMGVFGGINGRGNEVIIFNTENLSPQAGEMSQRARVLTEQWRKPHNSILIFKTHIKVGKNQSHKVFLALLHACHGKCHFIS